MDIEKRRAASEPHAAPDCASRVWRPALPPLECA